MKIEAEKMSEQVATEELVRELVQSGTRGAAREWLRWCLLGGACSAIDFW